MHRAHGVSRSKGHTAVGRIRWTADMLGRCSFQLPDPPGGLRELHDKDPTDEE
ncbi:hypothetical protein ABZY16_16135 [Streptomyces sp. NPDC006553]|uniref:hypothetical protein n=1 Tax=Streptomyces sp. NPDC006553 TaxID=3157180 RepID=UPI0033B3ED94